MSRRPFAVLGTSALLVLLLAAETSGAAARRRVPTKTRAGRTTTTTVTAVPTTEAPTTTAAPGVPAARITTFETSDGKIRMVLEAPTRVDVTAVVDVEALGFEEGNVSVPFPAPGATELTVTRSLNIDTQYNVRVRWRAPDGTEGTADTRVVAPVFPQPKYRGPVPVAGDRWTVLFGNNFTPTRRNPCAPIEVHYDPTNAPLDLTETIRRALQQASDASGIPMTLISVGRQRPNRPRLLVIDWTTTVTTWIGVTRQSYESDARGVIWRTNMSVSLSTRSRLATGRWETIVLHELGHVLGLQHSHDNTSLMFSPGESNGPWPWVTTFFTDGDTRGLHAVNDKASGGCSPTIERADLWNGRPGP
jgi:hypothetical protein